jgi:sec-independent protein translocase protein TatC
MPQTDHETELEHTKMSFGEHLEELRRALFRSIIALLLGFLIGLIFGRQVVDYIQGPLRDSLQRFYLRQAKAEQLAYLEEQRDLGLKVPDDLEKAAERVVQEGLVPQEYYASPDELAAALGAHYPDLAKILEARPQPEAAGGDAAAGEGDAAEGAAEDEDAALLAAFNREDLIHLRLYTPIESDLRLRIVELNVQAPFIIYLKAALAVGAVVASPFIY